MANIFDKSLRGVKTPHRKNTNDAQTVKMPVPELVSIAMLQNMGAVCDVLVKKGDEVKVGQVIGDSDAFLSVPVHSSVSGKVLRVDEIAMPTGARSKVVVIEPDKNQELYPGIEKPEINSREDFIKAVRSSGMVGLGGAGFPTHVKLNPKNLSEVDTLIINAAECEPYITSDYRAMIEEADDIIDGVRAIMSRLGVKNCRIGIEDNKPDAISKLSKMTEGDSGIEIVKLKSKYPQGAEKVLIYEVTHRVVPEGKLPADVGVIVFNVSTVAGIARYLRDGMPLISRRITVDGGAVKEPKNVEVLVGTSIREVLDFCGGLKGEPRKILMGGPMMGVAVPDESYPVFKTTNAILAFDESQVDKYAETSCIRCGRCVRSCPMKLMPLRYKEAFDKNDDEALERYKVGLCIECGSCAYECPARIPLVHVHRLAKVRLRAAAGK